MKKFYVITNVKKDENLETSKKIQDYIISRGGSCIIHENETDSKYKHYEYTDADLIPDDTEGILVIGGDGTMLQAAGDVLEKNIPLLGVNLGRVGYLCELEKDNFFPALDCLLKDEYDIEERMMLEGKGLNGFGETLDGQGLNDIVIYRNGSMRIVNFLLYVNGELLNTYRADGIIISTPTGSTGYSMSAGGPIVDPNAQLFLITPMNPHSINRRSIILGADDEIVIEIGESRSDDEDKVEVSYDGNKGIRVVSGDKIVIKQSKHFTKIIKISKASFLAKLRKRLQESK